jgi:uncharacterized membrane protein YagU involved in acid resistance
MNIKRIIIASLAVFVSFQILDYIIHGVILMDTYEAMQNVWRADMESKMWIMMVTSLFFSFLFTIIFAKGYENRGILEGARYGVLIGLLMNVVGMFNQYAVYPIPFSLALQWFVFGTIEIIICGMVVALIYKSK